MGTSDVDYKPATSNLKRELVHKGALGEQLNDLKSGLQFSLNLIFIVQRNLCIM